MRSASAAACAAISGTATVSHSSPRRSAPSVNSTPDARPAASISASSGAVRRPRPSGPGGGEPAADQPAVVGNPRPGSRTHGAALTLRDALADHAGAAERGLVDLAELGAELFDPDSRSRAEAPLLLELGARCPARGIYLLESELGEFPPRAKALAAGIL